MLDQDVISFPGIVPDPARPILRPLRPGRVRALGILKRVVDVGVALALLPPVLVVALVLLALNPWLNPGRLFYVQDRMGRDCGLFRVFKFRTMLERPGIQRGPFGALETDRITRMGRFLRRTRIDELPQMFNVLRGEMSLIGPRPDSWPHALVYLEVVPGYRDRHSVLPGISGYAQILHGYVDTMEGVRRKVSADLHYIDNASLRLEAWIIWRTLGVILARKGS